MVQNTTVVMCCYVLIHMYASYVHICIYAQVLLWFCWPETSLGAKSHFHVTLQNMCISFPSLITILMLILAHLKAFSYK